MKKVLALLLVLAMVFSMTACGKEPASSTTPGTSTGTTPAGTGKAYPNCNADGTINLDTIAHFDNEYDYTQNPKLKVAYIAQAGGPLYQQSADAYEHWAPLYNMEWMGYVSANGDSDLYMTSLQNFIDQGVTYIIMCVIFTIWANAVGANFLKFTTFRNILQALVITAFLTIGASCLLMAGHLDLSQASIGALGGMVMATILAKTALPWWVAIIICLLVCAVFGAANAFMVTKLRFPSFIATLAMSSMAKGIMYLFSSMGSTNGKAANVNFQDKVINFLGNARIAQINVSVFIMLAFFIVFGIIMAKTRFGAKVMLLGGNPVAAQLTGINATALMFILFILSAVMGGIGGIFSTARLQQGALTALHSNPTYKQRVRHGHAVFVCRRERP